mgnify:CR=1 FL=1
MKAGLVQPVFFIGSKIWLNLNWSLAQPHLTNRYLGGFVFRKLICLFLLFNLCWEKDVPLCWENVYCMDHTRFFLQMLLCGATMICFPCAEGCDEAGRWRAATIGVGRCSETNSLLSGMPPCSFFGVSSRLVSCSSELFCMRVLCDADGKEDSTC